MYEVCACAQAWAARSRVGINKRAASGESVLDPSSDSSPGSPSPRLEQRHHSVSKQSVSAHGSAYPSEVQLQQARTWSPPALALLIEVPHSWTCGTCGHVL